MPQSPQSPQPPHSAFDCVYNKLVSRLSKAPHYKNRAPDNFDKKLKQVLGGTDNERRLLDKGLPNWFAFVLEINHDKHITSCLNHLTSSEVDSLATKLRSVALHAEFDASLQKILAAKKQGGKRRTMLNEHNINDPQPPSKRIRVDQQMPHQEQRQQQKQSQQEQPEQEQPQAFRHPFEATGSTAQPDIYINALESVADANFGAMQPQDGIVRNSVGHVMNDPEHINSHSVAPSQVHNVPKGQSRFDNPKAVYLRTLFSSRLREEIIKTDMFKASMTALYQDPYQGRLMININGNGTQRLAREMFDQNVMYDTEQKGWVLKLDNGVNVYLNDRFKMDGAEDEKIKQHLGESTEKALQRSGGHWERQQLSEPPRTVMLIGNADGTGQLEIILSVEGLDLFTHVLWWEEILS